MKTTKITTDEVLMMLYFISVVALSLVAGYEGWV